MTVNAGFDLIVFDWDGTLMDSAGAIVHSVIAASQDLGIEPPTQERARYIIGLGLLDALQAAVPHLPKERYREMAERYRHHYLAQDHALARQLAAGLATIPGLRVEVPQTNIVFVDVDSRVPEAKAKGLLEHLRGHGILATGLYRLRFVAHLDVNPGDADRTVDVLRAYLQD